MKKVTVYGENPNPDEPNTNILEEYEVEESPQELAVAVIAAVRDPDQESPSMEQRVAAIEALLVPLPSEEPQP